MTREMGKNQSSGKGFFSNWVVKNIIGAAVFFAALVLAAALALNAITHHGRTVEVPDMTFMSVDEARSLASSMHLKTEVVDSIFIRRMPKGAVYSQNPKAGTQVKKGRRILLTINAVSAKKVSMPNLVGLSMRQAKAELSSRGLTLRKLVYVDDIATNNVIRQVYKGKTIMPGRQIDSGSEIDLEVGLNPDNNQTYIPDLRGMKYLRAIDAIHESSLNVAKVVFDKGIHNYTDSVNAAVVKQNPAPSMDPVVMGTGVTVYLSPEITKD